jgi:ABC-type amino acid transport system permease subunit
VDDFWAAIAAFLFGLIIGVCFVLTSEVLTVVSGEEGSYHTIFKGTTYLLVPVNVEAVCKSE